MSKITVSDFVKRQTAESKFSYFSGTDEGLLAQVYENFDMAVEGYRPGVVLVQIADTRGFFSATCQLHEGSVLCGFYEPRKEGELPRKSMGVVGGQKIPASRVDIVLYHHDVLAENNEQSVRLVRCNDCNGTGCQTCAQTGSLSEYADWEIISINCSTTSEAEPMTASTLLANHFHVEGSNDGGTSTGLTDTQLVEKLRESFNYWRDKAMISDAQFQLPVKI